MGHISSFNYYQNCERTDCLQKHLMWCLSNKHLLWTLHLNQCCITTINDVCNFVKTLCVFVFVCRTNCILCVVWPALKRSRRPIASWECANTVRMFRPLGTSKGLTRKTAASAAKVKYLYPDITKVGIHQGHSKKETRRLLTSST